MGCEYLCSALSTDTLESVPSIKSLFYNLRVHCALETYRHIKPSFVFYRVSFFLPFYFLNCKEQDVFLYANDHCSHWLPQCGRDLCH